MSIEAAATASNPYLAAASGLMSGLTGMGQSGPTVAYGGTMATAPINVGGLNVPARDVAAGAGSFPVKPLTANIGLWFTVGAVAIWYMTKK